MLIDWFKDVSRYTPRPRTTPLRDLPRPVPRLLNVLGFEWQVRTPRTDQAAPQEAQGRGPSRGHCPGHQRLHEGICDVEHDLVLNAKSKEEPRA